MIRPIYGIGFSVLKRPAEVISEHHPDLEQLIEDMWETMYQAKGVGLAAPQIGLSLRLFVMDTLQLKDREGESDEEMEEEGMKMAFINPTILEETGKPWPYEEGCLSIPQVTGDVERPPELRIKFQDTDFKWHELLLKGMNARVVQHEYDHLEGILFTDRLKPLKKRLIKRKLDQIRKGKVDVSYKMKFKGA